MNSCASRPEDPTHPERQQAQDEEAERPGTERGNRDGTVGVASRRDLGAVIDSVAIGIRKQRVGARFGVPQKRQRRWPKPQHTVT